MHGDVRDPLPDENSVSLSKYKTKETLIRAMQEKGGAGLIAQKSTIIFGVSSFRSDRYLTFALRVHGGCLRSLTED